MLLHLHNIVRKYIIYLTLVAVFVAIGFVLLIGVGDILILYRILDFQSTVLDQLFLIATLLGEPISYAVVMLFVLYKNYLKAITIFMTGIASVLTSSILKWIFSHPRPVIIFNELGVWQDLPKVENVHFDIAFNSFPSGHTFAAFSLFSILVLTSRPQKWITISCFILAMLVAISRMYLLHHFLKDILMGAVGGTILALFMKSLTDLHRQKTTWLQQMDQKGLKDWKRY